MTGYNVLNFLCFLRWKPFFSSSYNHYFFDKKSAYCLHFKNYSSCWIVLHCIISLYIDIHKLFVCKLHTLVCIHWYVTLVLLLILVWYTGVCVRAYAHAAHVCVFKICMPHYTILYWACFSNGTRVSYINWLCPCKQSTILYLHLLLYFDYVYHHHILQIYIYCIHILCSKLYRTFDIFLSIV